MDKPRYEVDEGFAFIGRTFEEYCRMFALDPGELGPGPVLDCPGGPGSFTAVASTLAPTLAVDPVYGPPPARLADRCEAAVESADEQLREKRTMFVWDEYGDVETRIRYLRAAFRRFLADYAANPARYVPAVLPTLPFAANAFDLALSGSLLFLYDDRLDLAFHLAALRELARVAVEVRAFPLYALDGARSTYVEPVVETLEGEGYDATLSEVPYEFQPGATEMLVVRSS